MEGSLPFGVRGFYSYKLGENNNNKKKNNLFAIEISNRPRVNLCSMRYITTCVDELHTRYPPRRTLHLNDYLRRG